MADKKEWKYINEIIRITYKCNWKCKFCNVSKVNNFWTHDVTSSEVIYKILSLTKKYTKDQLKNLNLSFSGWEPTLDKNICSYIKLAKNIWVWIVEMQTNWTMLFKRHELTDELIEAWLDNIFMAQHSSDNDINKEIWIYYKLQDFYDWVAYMKANKLDKKIYINLNIVITKINIFSIYEYIEKLVEINFFSITPVVKKNKKWNLYIISFGFCQPNWYAEKNKDEVLLKYDSAELLEIDRIVELCKNNNILLDFHFTSPPLCILDYPEYNLEYDRLKDIENDKKNWVINEWNLESYKILWREKEKINECKDCKYNKYCLWFYKNWIWFVWKDYVKAKVVNFLLKEKVCETK